MRDEPLKSIQADRGQNHGEHRLASETLAEYEQRHNEQYGINEEVGSTNLDEALGSILHYCSHTGHSTAHQVVGDEEEVPTCHIQEYTQRYERVLLDNNPYIFFSLRHFSFDLF